MLIINRPDIDHWDWLKAVDPPLVEPSIASFLHISLTSLRYKRPVHKRNKCSLFKG